MVDRRQRAFGYENLLVCDGSAIPANVGVNPSLTITAMAEHAMSHVAARHRTVAARGVIPSGGMALGKFLLRGIVSVVVVVIGVTALTWLAVNAAAPRPARRRRPAHPRHPRRLPAAARSCTSTSASRSRQPARGQRPDPRRACPPTSACSAARSSFGLAGGIAGGAYCAARPRTQWARAARDRRRAGHVHAGLRRRAARAAAVRRRPRDGRLPRAHPDRLRPVLRQPDRLGWARC